MLQTKFDQIDNYVSEVLSKQTNMYQSIPLRFTVFHTEFRQYL